jgi:hypothetical protein
VRNGMAMSIRSTFSTEAEKQTVYPVWLKVS